MKTSFYLILGLLFCGCKGGEGPDGQPRWDPPRSEKVTDLHYGMAVYLGGLDPMMDLSPEPRLTLCLLRKDTRKISIKQTFNQFQAGKSSRKSLSKEKLEAKLQEYGQTLRESMNAAERTRFEALVPSQLYGVKVREKDDVGLVSYRAKFETDASKDNELKAPREQPSDIVTMEQVPGLLKMKDSKKLLVVLELLEAHFEVTDEQRPMICDAMIALNKEDLGPYDSRVDSVFLRWAGSKQVDDFPRLFQKRGLHTTLLKRFIELDENKALTYVTKEVPDKKLKHLLETFKREVPEFGRKVALDCLESGSRRFMALGPLAAVGKPEDFPAMLKVIEASPENRQQSAAHQVKRALEGIQKRHPGVEIPAIPALEKSR